MKLIRTPHITYISAACIAVFGVILFVQSAQAGPITNPGGIPYIKMAVYQGVLSIVPGGGGDSVMEIGNAGRDIAGTGDLYIRPGGLTTGPANYAKFFNDSGKTSLSLSGNGIVSGTMQMGSFYAAGPSTLGPQDGVHEGGELSYKQALGTSFRSWVTDVYDNQFRIYSYPNSPKSGPTLAIDSNNGYVWVAQENAKLCFYGGDCRSWADISSGGSQNLQQVLDVGSAASNRNIVLTSPGQVAFQALSGDAAQNTSIGIGRTGVEAQLAAVAGAGQWAVGSAAGDIALRVNSPARKLFLGALHSDGVSMPVVVTSQNMGINQMSPSARLTVNNATNGVGTGSWGDAIATFANTTNSAIYAQQNGSGYAGSFSGATQIYLSADSMPTVASKPLLEVRNSAVAGRVGTAIRAYGSSEGTGDDIQGSAAIDARGANASAYNRTFGLYATAGTGAGSNYAGFFKGLVGFKAGSSVQKGVEFYCTQGTKVGQACSNDSFCGGVGYCQSSPGLEMPAFYSRTTGSGSCASVCNAYGMKCIFAMAGLDPNDNPPAQPAFTACTSIGGDKLSCLCK